MDKITPKKDNGLRISALKFFSPANKELTKLMLEMKKYENQLREMFGLNDMHEKTDTTKKSKTL